MPRLPTRAAHAQRAISPAPVLKVRDEPADQTDQDPHCRRGGLPAFECLRWRRRGSAPACAIGIANLISGELAQMTKEQWSFSISALQRGPGRRSLRGVNDFSALALRLLQTADLRLFGAAGQAVPGATLALPGAGTGLFASGRRPSGDDGIVPVTGEGGHAPLTPQRGCEEALVSAQARRFGRPRAERALSVAAIDLYFSFLGGDAGNLCTDAGRQRGRLHRHVLSRHCLHAVNPLLRTTMTSVAPTPAALRRGTGRRH